MQEREELILTAVGGDRIAQEELFQDYWDLIESVVRSKGASDSDVDDIVNTTLMMAFEDLPKYRPSEDAPPVAAFEKWLKTIAGNRVIDAVRLRKAVKRGGGWVQLTEQSQILTTSADVFAFLGASSDTASRVVARQEAHQCLEDALEFLRRESDEKQRNYYDAFRLRFLEGLTNEETAGELDCTDGQVRNWLRTARALLQERLGSLTMFLSSRG